MTTESRYLLLGLVLAGGAWAQEGVKQFSVVIDKPETEYTIDVGGTKNPFLCSGPIRRSPPRSIFASFFPISM